MRSANKKIEENPWYVLMTLYGETGRQYIGDQREVMRRNAEAWNSWMAQNVTGIKRKLLIDDLLKKGIELQSYKSISKEVEAAFGDRLPGVKIPPPGARVDWNGVFQSKDLWLSGFLFLTDFEMKNCNFSGGFTIWNSIFLGSFKCEDSVAYGSVFRECDFQSYFSFNRCKSFQTFQLEESELARSAIFTGTEFHGNFQLTDCKVRGIVGMATCSFVHSPSLRHTEISKDLILNRVAFQRQPIDLTSAKILGHVNMKDATWPSIDLLEYADDLNKKSKLMFGDDKGIRDRFELASSLAHENISRYETLRSLMSERKLFWEEHFFLTKEFESREIAHSGMKRGIDRLMARLPFILYRAISEYGWSIQRPMVLLLITWVCGSAIIGCVEWYDYWLGDWSGREQEREYLGVFSALGLGFSNTLSFLGLGFHIMRDEVNSLTGFSEAVAIMQMFLGPVFLFFALFAVRNRFRLR